MDIPSDEDPLSTLHHYNLGAFTNFTFRTPDDYLQRGQSGTRAVSISSDGTVMGYHWLGWQGNSGSLLNTANITFQVQTTLLSKRFCYGFDLHLCKRDGKPRRVQEFIFKVDRMDERWPYNAVYYTIDDWQTVMGDGVVERDDLTFKVVVPGRAQIIAVGTLNERNANTGNNYRMTDLQLSLAY